VIIERAYTEGAAVDAGDILFQIDPEPYEAVVGQAKAQLQRAEAALRQAERDKARADKLFETDAVSERQRDDALSAYELSEAEVALAEAALTDAQLRLDYTTVRSPIKGVTSLEKLPEGSLVNAGDALTTVTQLDPMYVLFSLPEGDPAYNLFMSQQGDWNYNLSLQRRNNGHYHEEGRINFTETRVDENTGTVRVRATFPNPENLLLPGQFVRIGFDDMQLPKAAIIPPKAVLATPQGSMVYVLGEGNAVTPRPVVLGPVIDGGQLVMGGLQSGERVISSSLIRIRPGMPVTPVEKDSAPKEQE
jgi:membrane fusion protein (multidrug efflux system)